MRQLINEFPLEIINNASAILGKGEGSDLIKSLEQFSNLVGNQKWLVGNAMSFADIAVAAQLSLIRFPPSSGKALAGKGYAELANNPKFQCLWDWKDELDIALIKNNQEQMQMPSENDCD